MTGDPDARPTEMSIEADPEATRRIAAEARGRTLLIDFFASRCCTSMLVGDLETRWLDPGRDVEFEPIGSVNTTPIVADAGLMTVLRKGGARIVTGGWLGRSLQVRLDVPEAWLDFLDSPAARRMRQQAPESLANLTPPTT